MTNVDLEQKAVERLKMGAEMSLSHYSAPLMLTYSGGKDSDLLLELALRAGIPFEVVHSHTTADAPETVRYVRKRLHEVELRGIPASIRYPKTSMWRLIPKKLMPPTRTVRYCCKALKESAGNGRMIATGVRWAESNSRAKRGEYEVIGRTVKERITINPKPDFEQKYLGEVLTLNNDNDDRRRWFERCQMKAKTVVNPIIDWPDRDVWDYLHDCHCETNPCYERYGLKRVGCVGCPMAQNGRYEEFAIWPRFKSMYLHSFEKMLEVRREKNHPTEWETPQDVFAWWMDEDQNQLRLEV